MIKQQKMISTIQIQTIDSCNSHCLMCPRDKIFQTKELMSIEKFCKVLNNIFFGQQKGVIDKKVKIVLQFENEPLLDVTLFSKIKEVKRYLPNAEISFYTNGTLILKYLDQLCSAKIDEIVYSNYGDNLSQFNLITGLKYNQERFVGMKYAIKELQSCKNVRVWDAWRNGNIYDFSSRAGLVKQTELMDKVYGCEWKRPYNWLHIHSNGDIVLCCQDWKRETKFANIFEDNLVNILESDRYKDMMEKAIGKKESDINFICKRCKFNK